MSAELHPIRLALRGDQSLPRELVLWLREASHLSAQVFALKADPDYRSMAFAYRLLSECRLDHHKGHYTLWVGMSGFDVTAAEAAAIHATFAPLGLKSEYAP